MCTNKNAIYFQQKWQQLFNSLMKADFFSLWEPIDWVANMLVSSFIRVPEK